MIPELELGSMYVRLLSNGWAKEFWQQHWNISLFCLQNREEYF
jgi:hypothetical protein